MSNHKKIYVTPSHTKKVFANMKRQGKDFSGRDTPLFQTMMVQAQEEGEGSIMPTVPQHTPTINRPSTSKPQKKQSRRKQRKETKVSQPSDLTEPMADETENVESVPTHSNDPLLSGEDRLKLNELMELCTSLSQRVIALETTKTNQTLEIDSLKRREDASKQGRKIADLDADAEVTLVDEAQGRNDDYLMFDIRVLDEQKVKVEKTLIEIKAAKPKAITTAATTTITAVTRPKARGVEEEDANIAEWDNVQAMIDVDYELAARLQAQEQEDLTIEERVNMFVGMDTELVKESSKQAEMEQESSSKRAGEELESDNSKKQKLHESVKVEVDDEAEMKKHMEIVFDEEVAINAIPLATKPPIIVDWKIIKEGKMRYFQIIRADGS
ncbi:hypothetical protein Tco_0958286 [Tanacetum coccineum]